MRVAVAQTRYATVELQLLGVQWAIDKCQRYLQGCPAFTVVTDHRPLVGLFQKSLPEITNLRLLLLREKTQGYSFDVEMEWVQGKTHKVTDARYLPLRRTWPLADRRRDWRAKRQMSRVDLQRFTRSQQTRS